MLKTKQKLRFELPILDFAHWLELGEVKPIKKTCIEICEKRYYGKLITTSILWEYRRNKQTKINTLIELAVAIEQLTGISKKFLYQHWEIAGKMQGAVFIPTSVIWKFKPECRKSQRKKDLEAKK